MTQHNDDITSNADMRRVSMEVADRLAGLGIALDGTETPDDLVRIQEAVEQFEIAVQSRGGDLMVDEGPEGQTREPDDPLFALPKRADAEPASHYIERLVMATDDVRRHRQLEP
jgi:hypothetical protein